MALATKVFNHALAREQWAQVRLAAHAGTTFAVVVGPARTVCEIADDGVLVASNATPALTLTISPLNLPELLTQPDRWSELVVAVGDAGLAATLAELALTLPWFVEREFARILGPIIGTRVADAGRALLTFPGYVAEHVGNSIARYVADDSGLAASTHDMHAFASDAAALAERVGALTARIAALDNGPAKG